MNDWPADPRLDEGLRRLVNAELMSARADAAGLAAPRAARRGREGRAVAGLGLLAVIAIVASLAIRGANTRGPGGGPGAGESPSASGAVTITGPTTPTRTGSPTVAPALSPTAEPSSIASPSSGTWAPAATMATSDSGTATLLLDGRVLIAGYAATSPEIYDPRTGRFTSTGPAAIDGNFEAATRLADGRVLFVGGSDGTKSLANAQIYDPATGKFTPTGSLNTSRMGHTATLLADGRVLIAGGATFNSAAVVQAVTMAYHPGTAGKGDTPVAMTGPAMLASAEIYDPKTGRFSPIGSMTRGRDGASATLLADGRVLIAGGGNEGSSPTASAEIYDPKTGKFARTGSMLVPLYGQIATLLLDGRVLISGGSDGEPVYSLETYDPRTGKFSSAGSMGEGLAVGGAALLHDGSVLFVGGFDVASFTAHKSDGYLGSCELWDPATGKLSPTGSMNTPRQGGSPITLLDGRVLVAGGFGAGDPPSLDSAELYLP